MISSLKLSDTGLRQMVTTITHICMSQEFKQLKEELEQIYQDAGEDDFAEMAFKDALYTMLLQSEEYTPDGVSLIP